MSFWDLTSLIPVTLFLIVALVAKWRLKNRSRLPVKDYLLRSPGESLRRQIELLDDRMVLPLFGVVTVGVVCGTVTSSFLRIHDQAFHKPLVYVWALGVLSTVLLVWRLMVLIQLRWRYDLGFSGERAVGEELNKLMFDGCHIFHDFPADLTWNIDHIVVSPSGVFAVETKAKRKKQGKGKDLHRVFFDGKVLQFPGFTDTEHLEQASRNAKWLSEFLTKATGDPVSVQPILTFPGWLIERTGKGPVKVLSHKEIRKCVVSEFQPKLSPPQIQRIVYQLEQKCRDVEF